MLTIGPGAKDWFIWFVWSLWFLRSIWFPCAINQINEIDQMNQTDQPRVALLPAIYFLLQRLTPFHYLNASIFVFRLLIISNQNCISVRAYGSV